MSNSKREVAEQANAVTAEKRVILSMGGKARCVGTWNQFVAPARPVDAYVVYTGDGTAAQALRLAESLRDAGLIVLMHAAAAVSRHK